MPPLAPQFAHVALAAPAAANAAARRHRRENCRGSVRFVQITTDMAE
jgi:hypothetical protein